MNSWLNDTMRPRHADGEISAMYMGAVIEHGADAETAQQPRHDQRREVFRQRREQCGHARSTGSEAQHRAPSESVGERTGDEDGNRGSDGHAT